MQYNVYKLAKCSQVLVTALCFNLFINILKTKIICVRIVNAFLFDEDKQEHTHMHKHNKEEKMIKLQVTPITTPKCEQFKQSFLGNYSASHQCVPWGTSHRVQPQPLPTTIYLQVTLYCGYPLHCRSLVYLNEQMWCKLQTELKVIVQFQ